MTSRILVVDDDFSSLVILKGLLSSKGWIVETCSDGESAMARLQTTEFDVLLTDQIMPGMQGTELIRIARAHSPRLRCVVLSGSAPSPEERGIPWVQKPIDLSSILAAIAAA